MLKTAIALRISYRYAGGRRNTVRSRNPNKTTVGMFNKILIFLGNILSPAYLTLALSSH